MSDVRLENISKRFGDTLALEGISLHIHDDEFFVLLGPTGAGKTTTLRVIAGLEKQDDGHVYLDDRLMDGAQPADRDVAFVFQQYSLYPNMSVYDNLAFPLRSPLRRLPEGEIRQRVTGAAEKLRITHLLERKTARLSGGEMQRVSIGRAIVRQPRIFLMDEPLSNLDAKLRESLRVELKHLQKTQGSTTLFVTHDQIEALTMADRIAVLDQGKIIQNGTPFDIYDRPATTFVAQMVGTPRINLIAAEWQDGAYRTPGAALSFARQNGAAAEKVLVGVRPEDVRPGAGDFRGEVMLVEPLGVETILHIRTGEITLLCVVSGLSSIQLGEVLSFGFAVERLHFFDMNGRRL
ncbi:MAG: ABC transporter ATP-binding protein [Anaerolineae bacterium]|nr:ABC transporter ATP-binding protein [Anaerolineae bacterium]NUQ02948.1 ABC transporter ATP-binding protein [Anaerolineae bacterium]